MKYNKNIFRMFYSLYGVTDSCALKDISLETAVEQALMGGVSMLQLREKNLSDEDYTALANKIFYIADEYGVPLIVNDNVQVAKAVDADGVHLGQNDMSVAEARAILGDEKIIGVTAKTIEQALQAEADGADYIGVGAVFPSSTKPDAIGITIDELVNIVNSVNLPVVAIGGINSDNADTLCNTGICSIAASSAIFGSDNIKNAAERLKDIAEEVVEA